MPNSQQSQQPQRTAPPRRASGGLNLAAGLTSYASASGGAAQPSLAGAASSSVPASASANAPVSVSAATKAKSKRIGQACDLCHRNKKKCSGERPICANCARANKECSYSRSHKRKGNKNAYVVELERRLMQIEGMLSSEGLVDAQFFREMGGPTKLGGGGRKKGGRVGTGGTDFSTATSAVDKSSTWDDPQEVGGGGVGSEDDDGLFDEGSEDGSDGDSDSAGEDLDRIAALRKRIEEVGQLAGLHLQRQRQASSSSGGSFQQQHQQASSEPLVQPNYIDTSALPQGASVEEILAATGVSAMQANFADVGPRRRLDSEEQARHQAEIREIKSLADSLLIELLAGQDAAAVNQDTGVATTMPTGVESLTQSQLEDLLKQLYSGNMVTSGSVSSPSTHSNRSPSSSGNVFSSISNEGNGVFGYEFQPATFVHPTAAATASLPTRTPTSSSTGKRRRTNPQSSTVNTSAPTQSLPSAHISFEHELGDGMFGTAVPFDSDTPEPSSASTDPLSNALLVRDQTTSTNAEFRKVRREGRGFGMDEVGLATLEMGMLSNADPQQRDTTDQLLEEMNQLSISNHNPSPLLLQTMSRLVPPVQFRLDLFVSYCKRAGAFAPMIFVPGLLRELQREAISPILGWAMCAGALVSAAGNETRKTGYTPESEIFFARAKRLVPAALDEPCLTSVQALLSMAMYATGSGRPSAAWMYSGMAVRMAHELRLNQKPVSSARLSISIVEQESRNRTWWACFILDSALSAIADRPPFLNVDDVTVDLPDDELWNNLDDWGNPLHGSKGDVISQRLRDEGSTHAGKMVDVSGNILGDGTNAIQEQFQSYGFRDYVQLDILFHKVVRYVKRNKAERAQQLRTVDPELAKLDSQLIDWFARLSDNMRLDTRPLIEIVTNESEQRKFVTASFLNLKYQTTRILLHRPELTLHNFAWPSGSSFATCTNAATTITAILERLLAVDPRMEYVNSFSSFCIFESGVIHLVNSIIADLLTPDQLEQYTQSTAATTGTLGPSMIKDDTDPSRNQQQMFLDGAKRSLRTHLAALAGLKRFWATAECYHVTLSRLVVENNILAPNEVYDRELFQRLPSDPQEYFNLLLSEAAQAQMSEMNGLQQYAR